MKCIELKPSKLKGFIEIPPSKSLGHRAIICASLAKGKSIIENIQLSKDITATIEGMKSFGVNIEIKGSVAEIKGNDGFNLEICGNKVVDCIESGSTIRFLIPLALVKKNKTTFEGRGKLVSRPLDPYYEIFKTKDIKYYNENGNLPLTVEGKLTAGEFRIKGNISSQFITGLLFALPLLEGNSKIVITTELESKGYVDLTIDMLNKFGIVIENNNYSEFIIKGNQTYRNGKYKIEGDFSQAAFWLTAAILGSDLKCGNMNFESLQGDKVIIDLIKQMGAEILIEDSSVKAVSSITKGISIDASECPDLVPILAVLGSLSEGETKIFNAERVRIKECDRLQAITCELKKLGADIEELPDGLIIKGKEKLKGGVVESWNDHRIAMALAIASTRCEENVIINDSECVQKSYPEFWEDFKKLGGCVDERNLG